MYRAKTSKKAQAESAYEEFLQCITQDVGSSTVMSDKLDEYATAAFGRSKFTGVFARDEIPKNLKTGQSCIVNNQNSDQKGEHWVAVARCRDGTHLEYDSFGRQDFLRLVKEMKTRDTERDVEQNDKEENCGNRCVAFLAVFYCLGEDFAVFI